MSLGTWPLLSEWLRRLAPPSAVAVSAVAAMALLYRFATIDPLGLDFSVYWRAANEPLAEVYRPRHQMLGWAYFAAILVGSVHLGWHYALDGIAASVIAIGAWALAPRVLRLSPGNLAEHSESHPLPVQIGQIR